MAVELKDVLRKEAAETSLTLKERMSGFANDTFRMLHKFVGGTVKHYSADEGDQTRTGVQTATRFVSTVAAGTAPVSATSDTVCPNLNASLLEGNGADDFIPITPDSITVIANGLAATPDDTKGVILENVTDATAEIPAQYSPELLLKGTVWYGGPNHSSVQKMRMFLHTVALNAYLDIQISDADTSTGAWNTVCRIGIASGGYTYLCAPGHFGCNGASPTGLQPVGVAFTDGGGGYGFSSAAQVQALITKVTALESALRTFGFANTP